MATIIIKNVGPIKDTKNLELNKINVFMGPQCSGKSTIAKIISFCTWKEKKMARDGMFDLFDEKAEDTWIEELKMYHRLSNGYFSKESAIYYRGNYIDYSFNCKYNDSIEDIEITGTNNENLNFKSGGRTFSSKIIYIPAERNFVSVIPNLEKFSENRDFIQDFVTNWFEAKRTYNHENKLSILDLGIKYHTDGTDNDFLTLDNGKKITLQVASSGLQSIVPLLALVEYIATDIYGKSMPMSVNERDALMKQYNEMLKIKKEAEETIDSKDLEMLLDLILSKNYVNSQFIIEEPEQNLFPSTQRDLVYHLLQLITGERDHRLTITTHSPYILYALNNCMMAGHVYDKMKADDQNRLKCQYAKIDPSKVSIYEITANGTLEHIQRENGLIRKNYFDKQMKELMDDFYVMLNYYS